ncbi:fibronectin type III domain-containing protein [Nonomuraea endophytica]|uniref:fibronectin type III domain-containing protein n=1 Tax=Nonomuraea endophytica TaxID=714136 RepID=UPI0037C71898
MPRDLPEVGFTGVTFALDLTEERFLLYGAMGYSTLPAGETVPTDHAASGLVYCAPEADGWSYAVAVGLGPGFRLGQLFTALRPIDAFLTVHGAVLVLCDLPAGSTLRTAVTAMKDTLHLVNPDAVSPLAVLDGLPVPAPPVPPAVDPLAMTQGAYFAARLDFSSSLMSKVLRIGSDHTPPSVLLFALIDHTSSANTVFGAQLPDIVVLSTLKFTDLALLYRPSLKNQVELTGSVGLTGVFDSAYTFDVTLVVNETGLTATVEESTRSIENPFHLPGVELSELSMEIGYTWTPASSSYALTGQALLGPIPAEGAADDRVSFKGTMALVNGKAELFEIAVNRDLSIGRLLAALVTGSGANWPSEYLDIVFYDGTFVRYATAAGAAYTAGLVVKAKIRLTLLVSLDLTLDCTFSKALETDKTYSAMDAKVTLLTPIDLLFVQLSGEGFTGGPQLKIHTGGVPTLGLYTAITFLGVDFGTTDITLRKGADGGTIIDGRLQTEIDVEPFGTLGCNFTYTTHPNRAGELTVTGWPKFSWVREMFDVFSTIRSLAGSGCGELAKLFASVAYHTTFDLTPAIRLEGSNLLFTLTGTYSFTVSGAHHPFLSVNLPSMVVEVATSTTLQQLPERIALEFALAAPRLVADLLNDPEKIAILVGMLVAQETLEAALQLVCEGLVEGAVAAAVQAAATAAATLGLTTITALEVLTAVTESLTESSSSGDGGGGGAGSGSTTPAVPVFKRLEYSSGKVTATWDAASRANGYTYELLDPAGTSLGSHDYTTVLRGDIVLTGDLPVGVYHGRVRAFRDSTLSAWSTLPLVKSPAPVAALALGESGVVVSWTDGTDADHYEVRVNGVVTRAAGTLRELVLTLEPGALAADVRAVRAAELPGDWSAQATFDLLPTPAGLTLRQEVAQLKATWTAPAGQFAIEMDGAEVRPAGPDTSMTFDPPFTEGAVYTFRVRATSAAGASLWSAPVAFTYAGLPAPGEITIGQDGQAFLLSWPPPVLPAAVPSVSFLAQLWFGYASIWIRVDENGNVVDRGYSFSEVVQGEAAGPYTGEVVRLSTNDGTLPPGSEFPLRIRYSTPDRTGPWTQTAARALDQVQIREAYYAGEFIHVAWDPFEGGSYEVRMEPGDLRLTPGTGTSVDISADELSPGTVYAFRIRPTVGDRLGVWSDPPARVAVLDPPSAVTVSYESGQITVGWQQVDGAQRYRVAVLNTYGYELRTTESQTEPVTIDATGLPRLHGLGVKVISLLDDLSSADSPTTLFDLIDPPADLTADWDGLRTRLTWSPVDGAAQYRVRLLNAQGTVLRAAVTTQTSAELLVAGETAQVRVVGQTWSTPVPVARYTVLPVSGDGPAILRVSENDLDNVYKPTQTPVRTGWVASVQGEGGPLSVLALLTAALVKAGSFTQAQAYAALRAGTEHPITDEAGGAYTTLCLGTTPGGACGAGTPHAEFGGVIQGVTGGQLDELYAIFRAERSGWVGAVTAPNGALDAILQLDVLLTAKGILTGNAPYQVFNGSLTVPFAREGTGPQVCVAFGTATNLTGTALPGARGSVVFGVTDERVPIYTPTAQNKNWLAFPNTPTLPLTLLLRLVRLLFDRGVLTGTEPYDVFNTRAAPPPVPGD